MIKKILLVQILFAAFTINGCAKDDNPADSAEAPSIQGYKLVWNDEFDGNAINKNKWEHEVNANGGGNNELQYYTDRSQNSYVSDGKLFIIAIKENYTGTEGSREYTSARMRTLNKGDWKYGRFEIKAKLPFGQGLWPAIWMLPTDWVYGGWAASGEIDIMELLGQEPNRVYGTLHYGGTWPKNTHSGDSHKLATGSFANSYHVFRLDWEEEEFRWYVDDALYLTQKNWYTEGQSFPAPFDQRFHMLLNVAVGGNWPGNPNLSTTFPQVMEVDYVRVYQKE